MAFYKLYRRHTHCHQWMNEFDQIMRPEVYAERRRKMHEATQNFTKQLAPMYAMMARMGGPSFGDYMGKFF